MSSDSDDDCYGNVAQKLQTMKNNYQDDKIETTNLLEESIERNDSAELDALVKNNKLPAKRKPRSTPTPSEENSNELPDVSPAIAPNKTPKRVTRASARNSSNSTSLCTEELPTRSKRRKPAAKTSAAEPASISPVLPYNQRGGTRGRGRKAKTPRAKGRGRRSWWGHRNMYTVMDFFAALMPMNVDASIPTYSVGNTEEYNDQSDSQALFSNQPKKTEDVVVVEDGPPLDENEELSVKVYWQSSEFFKFTIRRYQKLSQLFDYFAKKENVGADKLLLTFNDRILKPDDTPDSIGYSIVKFIDGGIVNQSLVQTVRKDDSVTDGIKVKFQCQNKKKPFELNVRPDDKFSIAMMKCAEHLEIPVERLRFEFDGDLIPGRTTASEMELEGGECIDVKILS